MTKYTMFSTKEDWEKLYKAVKKAGLDVIPFKKSQSYDLACVMYAEATKDYSLKKIKGAEMPKCKCGGEFEWITEETHSPNGDGYGKVEGWGECKECGCLFEESK